MFTFSDNCGFEKNFINEDKVLAIIESMKQFDPTPIPEGELFGVDAKHPQYDWFLDEFFYLLKDYTRRSDLKLVFGMYADVHESFKIHRDIKELPEPQPNARHFASFLIPISVDQKKEKCNQNCTLVFDNIIQPEPLVDQYWHNRVKHTPDMWYYKLLRDITWEPYSLIWWNSLYPHCGAHMPSLDFKTKQMIVVHTYV